MGNIIVSDRYSATGRLHPDPETVCEGKCEGMGIYPLQRGELNAEACKAKGGRLVVIGQVDNYGHPLPEDSWVFVRCPDCKGTGKRK